MNIWSNAVITNKGLALQAKLTQGNTLEIAKAVVGAGFVSPALLAKQTAVKEPKQTLVIQPVGYPETGKCAMPIYLSNEELETGYTARQIGLYANDPDEGEILYFIAESVSEDKGTVVPSKDEMPGYSGEWTFYFQYGQADGVTVMVDPSGVLTQGAADARYAKADEVNAEIEEMREDIETAQLTANTAQSTANKAMEAISAIHYTIHGVPSQNGILTYTGSVQSPSWNDFVPEMFTVTGTISGTNAGNYHAIFTPKGEYHWADGTKEAKTVAWVIERATIPTLPSQSSTLTYSGASLTPTWDNYNNTELTIGGITSAVNAGNHNATFTPTSNYKWNDGSIAEKTVVWKINKAAGSLSINKNSITFTTGKTSDVIGVTRTGDGSITATSSNVNVATVSVVGNDVIVESVNKNNGNAVITIEVAEGTNHTAAINKTCSVVSDFPRIYGVQWDGISTPVLSRTDDAATFTNPIPYVAGATVYSSPFDTIQPWAGMSRVTDAQAGELVSIPKYWYKWTKSGNVLKLQIADKAVSGFMVSPAHADRGDGKGERDIVYVGRYHCAGDYKSVTGNLPQVNITREMARTGIHNLGTTIWQYDFAMHWTVAMLYLVEFANWQGEKTIGYGGSPIDGQRVVCNVGYTDNMPYHTGTTATDRNVNGGTQYRNIEGVWDNAFTWCDGIYFSETDAYCIKNPVNFSDDSNGTLIGTRLDESGYITAWSLPNVSGYEYVLLPSAVNAGNVGLAYIGGYYYYYASNTKLYIGGSCQQANGAGFFYLHSASTGTKNAVLGCRLQKLP